MVTLTSCKIILFAYPELIMQFKILFNLGCPKTKRVIPLVAEPPDETQPLGKPTHSIPYMRADTAQTRPIPATSSNFQSVTVIMSFFLMFILFYNVHNIKMVHKCSSYFIFYHHPVYYLLCTSVADMYVLVSSD